VSECKKKTSIEKIEAMIKDPSEGLPDDIFLLISRITPLINVDLLIKNQEGQTLLTWRDDGYYPPGWHIPGGIIRYKETVAQRVHACALNELGADVKFKENPLAMNEMIHPLRKNRGHFISLLIKCTLIGSPRRKNGFKKGAPKPGEWAWHDRCPDDLIPVHEMYRRFI
jgi:colanic acid biosynthesis protein WcaH